MISQIGIERSAEISPLEKRLFNGAMWLESPVIAAAISRPETRAYLSGESEEVARVDEESTPALGVLPEASSLAPQRRQNLSYSRGSELHTSHSVRSLVSILDRS